MADHSQMKLGRIRAPLDPRVPALRAVMQVPDAAPSEVDWYSRVVSWPMLLNDQIGDCTIAALAHVVQQWTTYTDSSPVVMDDQETLWTYSAITGYRSNDPATDQGAQCSDVLAYWRTAGVPTPTGGPDTLSGFASVGPRDLPAIKHAIATFGNVYTGIALPLSAQNEDVWASTSDTPGSWGGHCVPLVGYNAIGPICVTWGALKQMTWAWWETYGEEAYALLSHDWMRATGTDPAGVDWVMLEQAMARL